MAGWVVVLNFRGAARLCPTKAALFYISLRVVYEGSVISFLSTIGTLHFKKIFPPY